MKTHTDIANAVLANALPHNQRQAMPVLGNEAANQMSAILRVLDAALAARLNLDRLLGDVPAFGSDSDRADVAVCFMAYRYPHAEQALRLWASAQNLEVVAGLSKFDDGKQIRTVDVLYKRDRIAWVQWPAEPITTENTL